MSRVSVEAASADRFADVQHALAGGGDGASCQCQWWMLTNAQFSATGSTNAAAFCATRSMPARRPGWSRTSKAWPRGGCVSSFLTAGFREVGRSRPDRVVVAFDLRE